VDPSAFRLVVDARRGGGDKIELTLEDLASLPQHSVVATLQCSGNRRFEMSQVEPTSGTGWQQGAISTAEFRGPAVRDVLALAGFGEGGAGASAAADRMKHCCFKGLDGMAASVILDKALSPYGDSVLALTMNGEPLPRDHG
jgi:sulfite oxidase